MSDQRSIDGLPDLCTREELAHYFGISVQTLARWAVEKKGVPVTKIGHAARYKKAHILAYLNEAA